MADEDRASDAVYRRPPLAASLPVSTLALIPLCGGLGLIYGLLVPLHLFNLDGRGRVLMVLVDVLLAVYFLAERRLLVNRDLSVGKVRLLAAANIGLPYLSLLLLSSLRPDPNWTGFVIVILISSGAMFLSFSWFAVSAAIISISWPVVLFTTTPAEPTLQFAAVLLTGVVAAAAIFASRRRTLAAGVQALASARKELRQREATERELRESEERLALAIRSSRSGSWNMLLNPAQPGGPPASVYFSPALKRLIGFADDEFPNSLEAWRERIVDDDRRTVKNMAKLVLMGHLKEHHAEYRIRHKSGEILWLETLGTVERDADGRAVRFAGIDRDISERVERQRTLGVLSRAVEQSPSIVLITDPEGDITYVNPKFTEVTGYEPQEVLGRNPRILRSGDTPPDSYSELWQTLKTGNAWHGEFKNQTKSNEPYWVLASISPIHDDWGQVTNYVGVQEDITARKRAEETLVKAQRLEAVGRLVSGIAHDFNNLLTSILGFSEMAASELEEKNSSCRPYLEQVISAGETAASLTRQLLAVGRQQVLRPQDLDLNAELEKTKELLTRTLGEDIEVVMKLDAAIGRIRADPGQLQQVLLNLAVNARDAMPTGGVLTFETSNQEIDDDYVLFHPGATTGSFVMLAISDTGCGMDSETLQQIFEPFFTTKKGSSGTGLGLATTYGIIKQSGGYIWAYSEPDKGSSFKIYMPHHEGDAAEAAAPRAVLSEIDGIETILLVEDEDRVRRLLSAFLTSHGYTVLEASCSEDALRIGADPESSIDLLITDLVLPTDNGLQLAEKLRSGQESLKVLLITGYAEQALRQKHALDPELPLLTKPFTMRVLTKTVRRILDDKPLRRRDSRTKSR